MRRLLPIMLLATVACGHELAEEETGSRSVSITDGVIDTGHPAVGMLDLVLPMPDDPTQLGTSLCTGTLVGQRTVVTAAHCLEDLHEVSFQLGGKTYAARSWKAHPNYEMIWDGSKYDVLFDIGVVLLQEAPPIAPKVLAQAPPTLNAQITLVGFGETGKLVGDFGTKRMATNTVAAVTPYEFNVVGTGNGVGNICHGDSGGPAFLQRGGVEVLVGINSRGSEDYPDTCGASEFESRVDVALNWLRIAAAGDIVVEGEQAPLPQDTTPPTVQILSPMPNATIADLLSVSAQVTDDGQLGAVVLRVDGMDMGVLQQAPYTFQVPLAPGSHVIQVVARDAAGNEGQASISVLSNFNNTAPPTATAPAPAAGSSRGMIQGSCSVAASAGSLGLPLLLFALLLFRRRR